MNQKDVIGMLGEPDRILPPGRGMISTLWSCSTCRKLHSFAYPVRPPSPCDDCGGIAFEKRSADQL